MKKTEIPSDDDAEYHSEFQPGHPAAPGENKFLIFPALDEFIGFFEIDNAIQSLIRNGLAEQILFLIYPETRDSLTEQPPHMAVVLYYDPEAIVRAVDDFRTAHGARFTGILAVDDEAGFGLSALLKECFGIPLHNRTTLQSSANKVLLKLLFGDAGIQTARHSLSGLDGKPGLAEFPNVTKLITGTGSEYSFVSRDEREWVKSVRRLRAILAKKDDLRLRKLRFRHNGILYKIDPRREFIMEEFVDGHEYSMDFLVRGGKVEILRVTKKFFYSFFGYFCAYHLLDEALLKKEGLTLSLLRGVARQIAGSLKIKSGIGMADFKLSPDGIVVIEASARPGLSVFIGLMQKLLGWTSFVPWAASLLKMPYKPVFPRETGLSYHIYAPYPGRIAVFDTDGLEKLRKRLDIVSIYRYNEPGDIIEDSPDSHYGLFIGFVLFRNPDPSKIAEIFETVSRAVKIRVEPQAQAAIAGTGDDD